MNQVAVIVHAKLLMGKHAVASVRTESKLKVGVISVCAVGFWFGAYFMFRSGFDYLIAFGGDVTGSARGIGSIVLVRMFGVLALAVFFMLIFSNILVAFSTLYRSREVQ